jgi:chemotaxis protein CheY-P-specific phosphatase CheC
MSVNDNYSTETGSDDTDIQMRYIIFELNKEEMAIPLKYVQEVLDVEKIRRIPKISDKFLGIYYIRGQLLPIVNFRKIVFKTGEGVTKSKDISNSKVIMLKMNNEIIGLVVDEINDIMRFEEEYFDNIPESVKTKIPISIIDDIVSFSNRIVKILNIKKIIAESLLSMEFKEEPEEIREKAKPRESKKKTGQENVPLILNKDQLDALREITNIASGKAAIAMSNIFKMKSQINININNVILKELASFNENTTIRLDQRVVVVRAFIKNDLNASIFLILPTDQLPYFLEPFGEDGKLAGPVKTIQDLDKSIKSAIIEFGNIIISHYCTGISDFLKIQVYHEVPDLLVNNFGAVIDGEIADAAEDSEKVVLLQTEILTKERTITGALLFIPSSDSVENFTKWLDVDSIVKILEEESVGKTPQDLQKIQMEKTAAKPGAKPAATPSKSTPAASPAKSTATSTPAKTTPSPTPTPTPAKKTSSPAPAPAKSPAKTQEPAKGYTETEVFAKVQSQKDYAVNQADIKDFEVTDSDLDTFRELGNIGAGNAGNALSQMLNKKVYLEIPPAKILSLNSLITEFGGRNEKFLGYLGDLKGLVNVNLFLFFTTTHIENLLQVVMELSSKKTLNSEADLNEQEQSAVRELLNILIGHYISAISDFLKAKIDPPDYQFFFKNSKQLFSQLEAAGDPSEIKAIVIETSINVSDAQPIKGEFIMLLHPKEVKKIITRINEIW